MIDLCNVSSTMLQEALIEGRISVQRKDVASAVFDGAIRSFVENKGKTTGYNIEVKGGSIKINDRECKFRASDLPIINMKIGGKDVSISIEKIGKEYRYLVNGEVVDREVTTSDFHGKKFFEGDFKKNINEGIYYLVKDVSNYHKLEGRVERAAPVYHFSKLIGNEKVKERLGEIYKDAWHEKVSKLAKDYIDNNPVLAEKYVYRRRTPEVVSADPNLLRNGASRIFKKVAGDYLSFLDKLDNSYKSMRWTAWTSQDLSGSDSAQGVKIHVPLSSLSEYIDVAKSVIPDLVKNDISFKIIGPGSFSYEHFSSPVLEERSVPLASSGILSIDSQVGKHLVLYPTDYKNFNNLASSTKEFFSEDNGLRITGDFHLGGKLHGRFCEYNDKSLLKIDDSGYFIDTKEEASRKGNRDPRDNPYFTTEELLSNKIDGSQWYAQNTGAFQETDYEGVYSKIEK